MPLEASACALRAGPGALLGRVLGSQVSHHAAGPDFGDAPDFLKGGLEQGVCNSRVSIEPCLLKSPLLQTPFVNLETVSNVRVVPNRPLIAAPGPDLLEPGSSKHPELRNVA